METLSNSYVNINNEDINYINQSLKNKVISWKWPFNDLYEKKIADYFWVEYSLSCSNGTIGILMILIHLWLKEWDEVILPCTAPIMTVLPLLYLKIKPIFVDNIENSFFISISDLNKKITNNTKLVINVPMWWYANNIEEIANLCKKRWIKLLEDNSHAHWTKIDNRNLWIFWDFSVYSTHERKLITTWEWWFILVKNKKDYLKLMQLRSFWEAYDIDNEKLKWSYGLFFWLNFKLSSINASIWITQLAKLDEKIEIRNKNAKYLLDNILPLNKEIKEVLSVDKSLNNYYSLALLVSEKNKKIIEQKLLENNIISDPLRYKYCPLYDFPIVKNINWVNNDCYNSEQLINKIFTLPTHEWLTKQDLDNFISIIKKVYA